MLMRLFNGLLRSKPCFSSQIPGDVADEEEIQPVVYEDKDSEEEESEIEMEIDEESDC